METRILRYFLAVAREGSISAAAKALHITQPTLSKQLKDLEESLGKKLLIRGSKHITLTDEGRLFRKRAQEIIDLVTKTESEIKSGYVGGDIYIGCGETEGMRLIAKTIYNLQQGYPRVHFHLFSGNASDVMERLDKGLLDFGVLIGPPSLAGYDSLQLPFHDVRGVLIRKDHPLAARSTVRPQDLEGIPIIASRNEMMRRAMTAWLGKDFETLNIVATFNLIFNAALMVEEGVGCALGLDGLVKESEDSILCFRPFEPVMKVENSLVWKKHQAFSQAAAKFLEKMRQLQ